MDDAGRPGSADADLPERHVTVNQIVAWNLAYFRKAAELKGEELGARLGWSKAVVSAAERSWDGRRIRQFSVDDLVAIALALGVPAIALFLPPPDAGVAVRYILDSEPGQPDIASLLFRLVPVHGDDSAALSAFRQRLMALGVSSLIDPARLAEDARGILARTQAEAAALRAAASQEAEWIIADAKERAEGLVANAEAWHTIENADQAIADLVKEERRVTDEMIERARREADGILIRARAASEQITSDARERSEALERDAQERYREALDSLMQSREELERRVNDLRAFEREYRSRLEAYLEGQLRDLRAGATDDSVFPALGARPPGTGEEGGRS